MPTWHYSYKVRDESKIARGVRYDVPVSVKELRDLALVLKGMKLDKAKELLQRVIDKKEAIPFRRYKGKQSHRRGLADKYGWPIGRYPVKAATYLLKLLEHVEANAENKDLDKDSLVIRHIGVHKGLTIKRWMPRAFGRSTPKYRRTSHIEVIVEEVKAE
jgi:large subunit ribosomal protein L22